jgi:hypothetical protein
MKFKQLAVAAATAALFATSAHADVDNKWEFVEELVEEVLSDPFDSDWEGNNGGDYFALDAAVLSAAINVEDINGSVSITGRDVTLSTGAATVSATATATAAESVAKATAIVGTDITTLAAGAINSSNVDVSGYQRGEDAGEDYTDSDSGDGDTFSFSEYEIDVPYTAVFQGAINAAAIDASVTIAATAASGIYHTTGGALALSNLSISTTALGAINSGTVRIGADLIEAAKLPATVAPQ